MNCHNLSSVVQIQKYGPVDFFRTSWADNDIEFRLLFGTTLLHGGSSHGPGVGLIKPSTRPTVCVQSNSPCLCRSQGVLLLATLLSYQILDKFD